MTDHFKPAAKFAKLNEKYQLVSTLWDGTDALREAGTLFLPKEPAESPSNYANRLARSVLFPVYKRTIKTSVGKAFAKSMEVKAPDVLMSLVDSADSAGTSLETFSKELLEDAINYGITYLMVDYPVITPNATLADERALGAAPYFVNIKPTSVYEVRVGYVGGVSQLTYFRFLEGVEETIDGDVTETQQVKELELIDGTVMYTIYRKDKNGKAYVYDSNVISGIDLIPVLPVYGNKESNFHGSPTLYDLAQLNIAHWETFSGYRNIVHAVSCPILHLKGIEDELDDNGNVKPLTISPNSAVRTNENGAIAWVEVSGGSINAAKEALADLEAKMAVTGLELTVNRPNGSETATGRLLDAAESNSQLKSIALDLEWSLYNAFVYAGQYIGVDALATEVQIDTTYTVNTNGEMTTVMELYREGLLSAQEVILEARARQLLQDSTVGVTPVKVEPVVVVDPIEPIAE